MAPNVPQSPRFFRVAGISLVVTLSVMTLTGVLFGNDDRAVAQVIGEEVPALVEASPIASALAEAPFEPADDGLNPAVEAEAAEAVEAAAAQLPPSTVEEAEAPALANSKNNDPTPIWMRAVSFLGIFVFLGIAWAMSEHRRRVNWRLVGIGLAAQFLLVLFVLKTTIGQWIFSGLGAGFLKILGFTNVGTQLLFGSFAANGEIMPALISPAFAVFPTIIFFSSLTALLYHWKILPWLVDKAGRFMRVTMGSSGAESLSAAGNIFVGMTEAPLLVKPYVRTMTMSELMSLMTVGFATVAGGVMASYVAFLQPYIPDIAQHLIAASVMSAPGGLVVAKLLWPETEVPETREGGSTVGSSEYANAIDAAADGAWNGLQLVLAVGAMLLAFVALIALFNWLVALPTYIHHGFTLRGIWSAVGDAGTLPAELAQRCDPAIAAFEARAGCIRELADYLHTSSAIIVPSPLSMEKILGWLFWPVALLSGVPLADAPTLAGLYGKRFVLNEFIAYLDLAGMLSNPDTQLSPRTMLIASYGLCGFANIGSIAIQIGGIGGMAPERRSDLAKIGFRAMIGGTLTTWITANIVGVLI